MASRAEHKRATLLRLCDAAITLCDEHGANFTIDEIAKHADISTRTVHRYIDSKEDLFFIHFQLGMELFQKETKRLNDQPLMSRMHGGISVVSAFLQDNQSQVLRALMHWIENPDLMRGYAVMYHRWVDMFANEARKPPSTLSDFQARVFGSSYMGIIDASMDEWMKRHGSSTVIEIVEEGLTHISLFEAVLT